MLSVYNQYSGVIVKLLLNRQWHINSWNRKNSWIFFNIQQYVIPFMHPHYQHTSEKKVGLYFAFNITLKQMNVLPKIKKIHEKKFIIWHLRRVHLQEPLFQKCSPTISIAVDFIEGTFRECKGPSYCILQQTTPPPPKKKNLT